VQLIVGLFAVLLLFSNVYIHFLGEGGGDEGYNASAGTEDIADALGERECC